MPGKIKICKIFYYLKQGANNKLQFILFEQSKIE